MSQTVSLILPVRDQEQGLRDRVQRILELLAELTASFDVLIVDYGSLDETREVAMELVREFPQVDFLDKPEATDVVSAIEAGIHRTRGEIILIHDPATPLGAGALQSLWQMRNDHDLVMAQSRSTDSPGRPYARIATHRATPADRGGSLQMIRRCAMPAARQTTPHHAIDRVTRTDLLGESPEAVRLPKLLARLRQMAR